MSALSDEDYDYINGLKREIRLLRSDLIDIKNEKDHKIKPMAGTQKINFKKKQSFYADINAEQSNPVE